jgi:hypothetical protein
VSPLGEQKRNLDQKKKTKFRRCLPAGSTLQNPFQFYVICDRRSKSRKMERRGGKVTGPTEPDEYGDVSSLAARIILPNHGTEKMM